MPWARLDIHFQAFVDLCFALGFSQVFLLTDGEVYDTEKVIGLVRANSHNTRYIRIQCHTKTWNCIVFTEVFSKY